MIKFSRFVLLFSILLGIAACATPEQPSTPTLSFTGSSKINVNVASIEMIEAYKSPFRPPNVEHLMPYSPADAVALWVKDRLQAVGSDKLLQITIVDASVIESDLPKTKGITGLFTVDQDKKYDARIEVEMRIYGEAALSEASTSVIVTRSITMAENASVNSRKAAYIKMIQDMMKMVNDKLENNMLNYMQNYINLANSYTDLRKAFLEEGEAKFIIA
jgi:hypothetical protein